MKLLQKINTYYNIICEILYQFKLVLLAEPRLV